ncbi:MAG: flagellar motor switch protein FliN [Gallionella sp.]|nr:flagellar motor switch protein FliN [Gallionella sp.]
MPDETATNEEAITADDWGAALAEQTTTADDWGAAMSEQASTASQPAASAKPHVLEQFGASGAATTTNDLDMILDIPVQLTVELGRTKMPIRNLLQLAQGSVVELAGMAGEPLDVMINGFLIAQGEVVVVNDKLGIRLTDVITPSERLRRLNR